MANRVSIKRKSVKRSNKKPLVISIGTVIIVIAMLIFGFASGTLEIGDFLGTPIISPSPSVSVSPSPSTSPVINGEWVDNTLLIGDGINGATLDIHFIDVGQGDSILIEFPDGKNMLIDGGDTSNDAKNAVINCLSTEGVSVLDYVMLTHTDTDHVGSLDDVLDAVSIKNLYIPDITASNGLPNEDTIDGSISTLAYERFMDRVLTETYMEGSVSTAVNVICNQGILTITDELYLMTIYCPEASYYDDINNNSSAEDKNNMSPTCVLTYAGRVIVLTGDSDEDAEQRFVDYLGTNIVNADVLKVAHHGGAESSNQFFLDAIDAEYAIISCGIGNSYDHPRQAAINRLIASGVDYILRTDINSDILLRIDADSDMEFIVDIYVAYETEIIGADSIS